VSALLAPLCALSGLCGLAYEVLWARMLGLQFGVSTLAVVVTVSAFMLGLAGGSAAMAAYAVRVARPLQLLALLESAIALFALLLPWGVRLATPLIDGAAGSLSAPQWHALLMLTGLLLLTLPAAAMGAGFPLMVEGWIRSGRTLGGAYGSNTAGAALGALAPLLLLPMVGWTDAVRWVAAINGVVAAGFLTLGRQGAGGATTAAPAAGRPSRLLLLNYAIIGAASLLLEMAWLRLFSLAMLRTEYVLALILAVMLLGMGLGSLIASRRPESRMMGALPWCASGYAVAGLWLLPAASAWLERARFGSMAAALLVQGLILAALTLPVTLSLGAWLPSLAARFRSNGSWLYASNALGGAFGALVYVLLVPAIGSAGVVASAAVLLLVPGQILRQSRRAWAAVPLVAAAAWTVAVLPPVRDFLPQAMAGSRDLYRYEDAIAITHVIEQPDGQRVLLTDLRRQDASSDPTAVFVQANQSRLPLLLHPNPHTVLFIGLGTGISMAGSLPFPDLDRSAVELSAGSIDAARRWFVESNRGAVQRAHVYHDDARHFLAATAQTYDVVIGDVFHPDLAGMGSLLAVEQFERVRERLAAGGLYVQWLALNQFDPDTLSVVLRSFRAVFPRGQMFLDGMHLALVGPRDQWQGAPSLAAHLNSLTPEQRAEAASEGDSEWLGRYWGPVEPSAGPVQHEWAPVIEFLVPRLQYDHHAGIPSMLRWLLARRPTLEQAAAALSVSPSQQEGFKRAFIGTELLVRSELANSQGSALEADHLLGLAFEADPHDRWILDAVSDRLLASIDAAPERGLSREDLIRRILGINPGSVDAWRALWSLQRARGDSGAAASRARMLELSPLDREARESAR
jgi:spermidine synthase